MKYMVHVLATLLSMKTYSQNTHVSQKKQAQKTTDKYGAVWENNFNKILLYTYLIATFFTYHQQKQE